MAKIIKSIVDKFTPPIVHHVHNQGTLLTILWVSSTLIGLGLALAIFCLYSRVLVLEQVITVLATK